jgi:hypothetical protein
MQPDFRDRMGVEVTLGRQLSAHAPRPAMLVKYCSGGTSIKNFLPEENNHFQPMVKHLKTKHEKAMKPPCPASVLELLCRTAHA